MRTVRLIWLVAAGAVAFVMGFYAGIFALLSIVDFDAVAGWQFVLATVPTGGLAAGLAAAAVAPHGYDPVVVVTPLLAELVAAALLVVIDGDFGVAIVLGGIVAVSAAAFAAVRRAGRGSGRRPGRRRVA